MTIWNEIVSQNQINQPVQAFFLTFANEREKVDAKAFVWFWIKGIDKMSSKYVIEFWW